MTKLLIAIQARSTSQRFPNKINQFIGTKTILQHVIDSCVSARDYINYQPDKMQAKVVVVIPEGDLAAKKGVFDKSVDVVEGDEHDVLSRYFKAIQEFPSDYIVRVTGDCPLLPPHIISQFCVRAAKFNYDYMSNVFEESRTAFDGMDCEVISARLMYWLMDQAKDKFDREHVTTYFRKAPPDWAKYSAVIGFFNTSGIKLSVDTPEDLERVREHYNHIKQSLTNLQKKYKGRCYVNRL